MDYKMFKYKTGSVLFLLLYTLIGVASADVVPGESGFFYIGLALITMLISMGITIAIEVPIAVVYSAVRELNVKRVALTCVLANLVSYPLFFFYLVWTLHSGYFHFSPTVYLAEFAVILIEAAIYWRVSKINWRDAMLLSFIANVVSAVLPFELHIFIF